MDPSWKMLETPRNDRQLDLSLDEYFMTFAFLAATMKKDPISKVGVCIVNKKDKIISTGFNDMPSTASNENNTFWAIENEDAKHKYVCNAVLNAIINAHVNLEGCKLYTTLYPSANCIKMIIQSGITEVVYASDKNKYREDRIAENIVKKLGVNIRQFHPTPEQMDTLSTIDFEEINNNILDDRTSDTPRNIVEGQELSLDEYFMAFACLAAKLSKDPNTKVGACIVNKKGNIISTGFNDMPGTTLNENTFWENDKKYKYVCYAVLNAIINAQVNLEGCKLYTSLYPSVNCIKMIIQSGITEVVYVSDKYKDREEIRIGKDIVKELGFNIRQFHQRDKILINFEP